jgi:hypothetical protein
MEGYRTSENLYWGKKVRHIYIYSIITSVDQICFDINYVRVVPIIIVVKDQLEGKEWRHIYLKDDEWGTEKLKWNLPKLHVDRLIL